MLEIWDSGEYLRLIESGEPFAQANYGDGEWACMLGDEGTNCDGTVYDPKLREALRKTLWQHTGFWCGTNPGKKLEKRVVAFCEKTPVPPDIRWLYKETISGENVNGRFAPFLKAFRGRELVVVGHNDLAALPQEHFGDFVHVGVRPTTAWKEADSTADLVRWICQTLDRPLVLFASGMGTNLVIHKLWGEPAVRDSGASLLDIGATLDPYVGIWSRNAYRKEKFQRDMMPLNLAR